MNHQHYHQQVARQSLLCHSYRHHGRSKPNHFSVDSNDLHLRTLDFVELKIAACYGPGHGCCSRLMRPHSILQKMGCGYTRLLYKLVKLSKQAKQCCSALLAQVYMCKRYLVNVSETRNGVDTQFKIVQYLKLSQITMPQTC